MKKQHYIITIKNGISTVKAKGYESTCSMSERDIFSHMLEIVEINKKENRIATFEILK